MSPELFITNDIIHDISFKRFLYYVKILQKFKRPNCYPPDSQIHWSTKGRKGELVHFLIRALVQQQQQS